MDEHDASVLASIAAFREAGFALHWLHPNTKRPIGNEWSSAPVASLATLRATHAPGNNLGVRPGALSALAGGGYLHIIDLDIRISELSEEAWETLEGLFPDVDFSTFPTVISGSGGESRHIYIVSDKPFHSKKLAVSEGKHRSLDPSTGKERWRYDWEIELFGNGKQAVMPPSIHPETGLAYAWEAELDLDLLSMGLSPAIPSDEIEAVGAAQNEVYAFESREPLTFEPGALERDLDAISVSDLHYDDWVRLGQALHHQFGGSEVGFDLWLQHTRRSIKFTGESQVREMRRSKWRSFGRYRGAPVTMGTIRQWAIDARRARLIASFDEEDEDTTAEAAFDGAPAATPSPAPAAEASLLDDDDDTAAGPDIDDMLGGDDAATDTIDDIGTANAAPLELDWMSLLDFTDGEVPALKGTLHNIELIVANDARLLGLAQLNEFTQEIVQRTPPGLKAGRRATQAKPVRQLEGRVWQVADRLNGDLWSDDRDFAIRSVIEAPKTQGGYNIKLPDRDLKAAVSLAAQRNAFHPVREYLTSLTWDGTARADRLWVDYVGAPDDAYHRDVARIFLVAAVARIFEPGHKFDFAVILEGLQGKRKSTFIKILGRSWFAELDGDFHDPKQMVELMQGAWIMEIPELSGFGRADVRTIKAFISRQTDRARLAYARRAGSFPRQCVFIGSTNDREYLKDDSGGRRWFPMPCTVNEIDTAKLEREIDQIWAEAVVIYREMRRTQPTGTLPLFLSGDEARTTALQMQESRRVESADDAVAGRIAAWLDRPINDGGFEEEGENGEPAYRDETCLIEIWCECMAGDPRQYNQTVAQAIGRSMRLVPDWSCEGSFYTNRTFGRQRVYRRGGNIARLIPANSDDLLG